MYVRVYVCVCVCVFVLCVYCTKGHHRCGCMSCYANTLCSVSYGEEDTYVSYEEEDACHVMAMFCVCTKDACCACYACIHACACMRTHMHTCTHVCSHSCMHTYQYRMSQMYARMHVCPPLVKVCTDACMPPIYSCTHTTPGRPQNWVLPCRSRAARQSCTGGRR